MLLKCAVCWLAILGLLSGQEVVKPELQLAKTYAAVTKGAELDLKNFWVSEKLDGVRGYWDGADLRTRSGRRIHAPAWFTSSLPAGVVTDGELWISRSRFDEVSGIVRTEVPDDHEWRQVKYCIFDLPEHGGTFDQRVKAMQQLVKKVGAAHFQMVEQRKVGGQEVLQLWLAEVVKGGGEGLMLHRGSARYQAKRTNDLIKLKPLDDAEAEVVSYVPGKGKFQGMLGALVVESQSGARFRIGSGFSLAERENPPAIGSTITYQHNGMTSKGLPRFARFLRVRVTP